MHKVIILVILVLTAAHIQAEPIKIYSSKTKKEVKFSKMVKVLKEYDVVFFGELHDNTDLHNMEEKLFKVPHKKNKSIALSLEMFERDVQPVLDSYISGAIEEAEFLSKSRPGPNYNPDYKLMVEFAKKHKIPVIAANVPRRHASGVHNEGPEYLSTLPESEKGFVAKELKIIDDEYKRRFVETMKFSMSSSMHSKPSMNFDKIYAAQCIKDDTMAESIFEYLQANPNRKVLHVNGDFHSNAHLGTAQKLKLLAPGLKIAVITPQVRPVGDDQQFSDAVFESGDFILKVSTYE